LSFSPVLRTVEEMISALSGRAVSHELKMEVEGCSGE